jgi:hypothetical protein
VATATPCAACPSPVTQTVLKNGVVNPLWGQAVTLTNTGVSAYYANVTDNLTGDTVALAISTTAGSYNCFFTIPTPVNISNYYANGHLQFDVKAANASTLVFYASYGNTNNGNGCSATPVQGLSQTQFVHVSIPLSTLGSGSCGGPSGAASLVSVNEFGGYDLNASPGVQFYLNNYQITPN